MLEPYAILYNYPQKYKSKDLRYPLFAFWARISHRSAKRIIILQSQDSSCLKNRPARYAGGAVLLFVPEWFLSDLRLLFSASHMPCNVGKAYQVPLAGFLCLTEGEMQEHSPLQSPFQILAPNPQPNTGDGVDGVR